jgi:hypothetical protein
MEQAKEILDKYGREWFNETDNIDDDETGFVSYPNALKAVDEALKQGDNKEIHSDLLEALMDAKELIGKIRLKINTPTEETWIKITNAINKASSKPKPRLNVWGNPIDTGINFSKNAGPRDL